MRIVLTLGFPANISHAPGRYVSELSYIHTKLMIVDDRRVIVRTYLPSYSILFADFCFSDGLGEFQRPQSKSALFRLATFNQLCVMLIH